MSLLDDVLSGIRKALDVAREKGELGVSFGRLRIELLSLGRERDALYNRLGRLAHESPGDRSAFEPVIAEIDRVSAEIGAREEALRAMGQPIEEPGAGSAQGQPGEHADMTESDSVRAAATMEPANRPAGESARDAAKAFENQGPASGTEGNKGS